MSCIVQVVTTLELGGAQKICLRTAKYFHDRGYPSYLIFGEKGPLYSEAKKMLGERLIHASRMQRSIAVAADIAALLQLRQLFDKIYRKHGAFTLHTHSSKAGILGRLAANTKQTRQICHTVHGFAFPNFQPRRRWLPLALERLAGHQTDHAFFVSHADQLLAQAKGLFANSNHRIIRAGVDSTELRKASYLLEADHLFKKMGFAEDDFILVTVANAKEQKDPLFHVDILKALHEQDPRYHLVFLGDGPLLQAMKTKADELKMARFLHTPGFVPEVAPYLQMADGFLLASRFEGLPCAVIEALVLGLPTFVRDSGWAGDLENWAETLFAMPSHAHPKVFSTSIHNVLQNRPSRLPSSVPKEFTIEGMLEALEQTYSPNSDSFE